jgi:hypothetical protein
MAVRPYTPGFAAVNAPGLLCCGDMAELIWIRDEESPSPTEYADHGRFRATITRIDDAANGKVTIRYFIRDLDFGADEQATFVQVAASRAADTVEHVRAKLEAELMSRPGGDTGMIKT